MGDEVFIDKARREQLKKAYDIIDKVKSEITIDHVEYTVIKTALHSIKRAIEYETNYN